MLSHVQLFATPWTAACQASLSITNSQSLLKLMSIELVMQSNQYAAAAKSRQSCPTPCDSIDGSLPGSCPWDSPGKNTGVGCHVLLQSMKAKSESEVAQSWTLSDPVDCSPPGSSVHGIFQARELEWGAIAFSKHRNRGLYKEASCIHYPKVIK